MLTTWVKHSIAFLPFSLPSPSSLLKLPIKVAVSRLSTSFCYHSYSNKNWLRHFLGENQWPDSWDGEDRAWLFFLFTLFIYSLFCSGCLCFQFRTSFCFVFFLASFQFFSVRALEKASAWFSLRLEIILPTKCEWCDKIGLVSICERRNDPKGQ